MVAPTLNDIQLSKWRMRIPTNQREATKMEITTVGIDLAKNVFQVHGVDQRGKVVVQKRLRREQVLTFFTQQSPCLVGMEACGWARRTF